MEMVMRFSDSSSDVEVLSQLDGGLIQEKLVNIKDCAKEFLKVAASNIDYFTMDNFDGNIIYYSKSMDYERYIIHLNERKIKCTYRGKGYSIIHPNSIFVLFTNPEKKIYEKMEAYCIKEYVGKKTKLYHYPFPNMLSSSAVCTGTISKDATDPIEAILNVIEGNYTHDSITKDIKTTDFFKSIKKEFNYSNLRDLGITAEYLIKKEFKR